MPVLRHDDVLETGRQSIDERDDLVASFDRQRPAGHEIGLQVDREENVPVIDRDWPRHGIRPVIAIGARPRSRS